MKRYNPNIHKRRSIRLKGYDYASAGLYFITLCVQDRVALFGKVVLGEMERNYFGDMVYKEWQKTAAIRKNCSLGAFIIMPNHFHAILSIDYAVKKTEEIGVFKSPSQTIGAIIRGFKGATTKQIKALLLAEREKKAFLKETNFNKKTDSDIEDNLGDTGELQFAPTEGFDSTIAPTEGFGSAIAPTEGFDSAIAPTEGFGSTIAPTEGFGSTIAPTEGFDSTITELIDLSKSIWQRDYYEHIIRNQKAYVTIENYIINNPKKWEEDKFYKL